MTDTSGISVCFGNVQDEVMLDNAKLALREMKAKWSDKIQIDTTHFVCTTPAATPAGAQASGGTGTTPGVEYHRALKLSIPIVQPHWILACHSEKKYVLIFILTLTLSHRICRMVAISNYYLGVTPSSPNSPFTRPHSMSQASLPNSGSRSASTPPPNRTKSPHRASMPVAHRTAGPSPSTVSPFLNQSREPITPERSAPPFAPTLEESPEDEGVEEAQLEKSTNDTSIKGQKNTPGEMNPRFRFPSPGPSNGVPVKRERKSPPAELNDKINVSAQSSSVITPSAIEVPPPPPVEKEHSPSSTSVDEIEDDVGDTVDIPLN